MESVRRHFTSDMPNRSLPAGSTNDLLRLLDSPRLMFLVALCARVGASVYILTRFFSPRTLFVSNESSHIAAALVSGVGFASPYAHTPIMPTAQQPPIYPLILAGVFKLFGVYATQSAWIIVGLHALAGAFTAVVIYRLGCAHFGRAVGIVGGWVWALPWLFQVRSFTVSFTSAYFAGLGFAIFLLLMPRTLETGRGWFLVGTYAGLLLLLQPTFLAVFAVYGICLARSGARRLRMWRALATLSLVVAPWIVRNYLVFHRWLPLRDNFGLELWLGNRPGMTGTRDYSLDFPGTDPANYVRMGEIQFMEAKKRDALRFIASDPRSFVRRSLRRVLEFWHEPYPVGMILLFSLGWVGAVLAWNKPLSWLFISPLIVYPLVYYVTHNFAGYRYPIEPEIILLAAYALVELSSRTFAQATAGA